MDNLNDAIFFFTIYKHQNRMRKMAKVVRANPTIIDSSWKRFFFIMEMKVYLFAEIKYLKRILSDILSVVHIVGRRWVISTNWVQWDNEKNYGKHIKNVVFCFQCFLWQLITGWYQRRKITNQYDNKRLWLHLHVTFFEIYRWWSYKTKAGTQ